MDSDQQKKIRSRLNRISGQVNGIGKMIDEDRYCIEILDQIAAVRSALDKLGVAVLSSHLEHCMMGHGEGAEHAHSKHLSREELLDEMRTTLGRFLK
jgi:DNA-binding FrmR family transcriptional regulator